MSLPFYMDHNVPRPLSEGLRRRGFDVLTAREDRTDRLSDDALLERSTVLGRIFVTEDRDFARIASERLQQGHLLIVNG